MAQRDRTYSKHTRVAAQLLGQRIQIARKQKRWSEKALAERAGVSRSTVRKIERGDLGASIGLVFELAILVGLPIFHSDSRRFYADIRRGEQTLRLLPKRIHDDAREVDDDF